MQMAFLFSSMSVAFAERTQRLEMAGGWNYLKTCSFLSLSAG